MAYQEFYCQNGGSNLNAGSTTNNSAAYTSTNGNWNNATAVFTPTDGSTPASTVSANDWVSVYLDGAITTVSIFRVTSVDAGVNGAIHCSTTSFAGASPSTGATGRSLKAGGAWKGPNGSSGFPMSMSNFRNATNSSGQYPRINLKNDQTYSITSAIIEGSSSQNAIIQGYTSTVGDGGKAIIDAGTNNIAVYAQNSTGFQAYIDLIFSSGATAGTNNVFATSSHAGTVYQRCVFHGGRGAGISNSADNWLIECEAYDNNKSNTLALGGFVATSRVYYKRCISHDNSSGVNAHGFYTSESATVIMINCIADTNGGSGVNLNSSWATIIGSDFYNNTGDGIKQATDGGNDSFVDIENCNFVKNGGAGINNTVATHRRGWVYNCGYGSGSQANGSADTLRDWEQVGTVTYASGVTPWHDPGNGDFRIDLLSAIGAGRGAFTETASSYSGSIGYPDIGAVQSIEGMDQASGGVGGG